jgi:hypothetical protein
MELSSLMKEALQLLNEGDAIGLVVPYWIMWHVPKSKNVKTSIKTTTIHALERRGLVTVDRSNKYRYVASLNRKGSEPR